MADYTPPDGDYVALNFSGPYTPPHGDRIALNFGAGDGPVGEDQYVFPGGWASSSIANHDLQLFTRYLLAVGWGSLATGGHAITNNARLLHPLGWSNGAVGSAALTKPQDIWPSGWASGVVGLPEISNWERSLLWQGRDWQAFGAPTIYNYNQFLYAGNINPRNLYGRPAVSHREFYPSPPGINSARYGAVTLSHGVRALAPAGINSARYGSAAWLSHSPRYLTPSGIHSLVVGNLVVAPTRYLFAQGWDSQTFGTTIKPPSQVQIVDGWRSDTFGLGNVSNYISYVRPPGWLSHGEEAYRFGRQEVFNQTQVITQRDDGLGGMAGDFPAAEWTLVTNRNRDLGIYGFDAARYGYTLLYNNARLLERSSWDSQSFGRAFVAGAVQELHFDGWDSQILTRWSRIYNNARLVESLGRDSQAFGWAHVESNRRYFRWLGNWDSQEFGAAFLADRVRTLEVERRNSIEPPQVDLPLVKLNTRYLEPFGVEPPAGNRHYVYERFNVIAPRWTKQGDWFGDPFVKNLTPELRTRGRESNEFGNAFVRTQWRIIGVDGADMQLFGRSHIADRTKSFRTLGIHSMVVGDKARIYNDYVPPPDPTKWIRPSGWFHEDVPDPAFNVRSFDIKGWDSMAIGQSEFFDNAILPDSIAGPGNFGAPFIENKVRTIYAGPFPIGEVFEPPKMRVNPHTVYAVMEAPSQAIANHEPRYLHYVNSDGGDRKPGEVFGNPRLSHFPPPPMHLTGFASSRLGNAAIFNATNYLYPDGFTHRRMGVLEVLGGDKVIEQWDSPDVLLFGRPTVAFPADLVTKATPKGWDSLMVGTDTECDNYHRARSLQGWDSMGMGVSGSGPRFMRQRLWVGAPDNPTFNGWDNSAIGEPWISYRVREYRLGGNDNLLMEYDLTRFADRMRVEGTSQPPVPSMGLWADGFDTQELGFPDVQNRAQFINPDGNGDMSRSPFVWQIPG
ncbi:hypothetical protein D8I35_05270 [Corticibacter populi]|uniref:Uncharacterized protein n=1 Tax=Corticibacter populi TaxID=1550736 RepID=A0A3M6R0S6_9BURK|nr:hypothetical protein [Corticibacter populi]RMX08489.1 hypothetical protein D8I35_05270 [Corticibacter populi]RZS35802.1 hypothetical protein EV687_0881 [Corticibacter populi]